MLKYLKIWQKFALIAVAFSIPIMALLYFLVGEQNKFIAFSAAEAKGVPYLQPLYSFYGHVAEHRDLSVALAAGNTSLRDALEKNAQAVDADLRALDAQDAKYGKTFGSTATLSAVKQEWQTVRTAPLGRPEQVFDTHGKLLHSAMHLNIVVGNASNLILDPDVDSYWCMDNMIFKVPAMIDELSAARGIANPFLVSGATGEAAASTRATLAAYNSRIEAGLQQMGFFLSYGLDFNPSTEKAIRPLLTSATQATQAAIDLLGNKVIRTETPQVTMADLHDTLGRAIQANLALSAATSKELARLVDVRIGGFTGQRTKSFLIVGIAMLLSLVLLFFVVRAITRPVAQLSSMAEKISLGDLDIKVDIDSRDEIGTLSEGFKRMQTSLKAAMEQLESRDSN